MSHFVRIERNRALAGLHQFRHHQQPRVPLSRQLAFSTALPQGSCST
jgi:hypothetical protein